MVNRKTGKKVKLTDIKNLNIQKENTMNYETVSKNPIEFKYKNQKGKISNIIVIPIDTWYDTSDFHDGEQWFLKAYDYDKEDIRNNINKNIKLRRV